jgi:hypothetical protein
VVSRRVDLNSPNSPNPARERSFWELLPRRNLRRALFLILALGGVLFIKHTGGLSFGRIFDGVAPAESAGGFQHLEVRRPAAPRP